MKNIYIIAGLLILSFTKLNAQTESMYSQYMFNMLSVNPAYAGNREATNLNLFQRRQWAGLDGAPQTTSVSIDGSYNANKIGWGIQMYDDKLGVEKASGAKMILSTHLQVSQRGTLSAGLNIGLMNYRVDLLNVKDRYTPNDPAFYANLNKWLPDIGMGIFYNTNNFYAGLSIPNVLRSKVAAFDVMNSGIQKINNTHLYFTTGFVVNVNEDIKIKPSTMLKAISGAPIQADFNTNLWLKDVIGIGASYRTGDAVISMLELQATETLKLGYAYDISISPLKYYNNGTHEIILRYEFGNNKSKIKSTRYF